MKFVGLDLAWSNKNGSGIAIIEGNEQKGRLTSSSTVFSDEEIMDYIRKYVGEENAIVAIDAPLIVPNLEGRRVAEKIVGNLFRKYDAGAHPANRQHLTKWTGEIRGEVVVKLLEKEHFIHNPYFSQFARGRFVVEVYPHPSMVVIFNLKKILKYKDKPKRDYSFRWQEFRRYQSYLKGLENDSPPLYLPSEIVEKEVERYRASLLKEYEDLLDGIFCGYIAYYAWVNPNKCAVLGNMEEGYILTPVFPSMQKRLKSMQSQRSLLDFS